MTQNGLKNNKSLSGPDVTPDDGIIVCRNLTKKFGKNLVLDNICFAVEPNKTTVVIGPSGCGKTVLIKHFIGLLRPSSGEVYFKGKRIDNAKESEISRIRAYFGFLFQGGALFDSLNVTENILFPVKQHYKVTENSGLDELVKMKLAMVGLDGFQHYFPARLSGGQKKRVALARAIALNPEGLFVAAQEARKSVSLWPGQLRLIPRLFSTMSLRPVSTLFARTLLMS